MIDQLKGVFTQCILKAKKILYTNVVENNQIAVIDLFPPKIPRGNMSNR